jgi:branched-subunit amino acid aminotransferase/4-amino-4-deoxychorismate lyase
MDDVLNYVSKNLTIVEKNSLSFPFSDYGFLYGYGLFESIKIQNSIPQLLNLHINRIERGAIILDIPFNYSENVIHTHIKELIEKNNISEGILNFYLTPGDRGSDPSKITIENPFFLIVIRPWPQFTNDYSVNMELRQESFLKTPIDRFKTLSWMKNVLEQRLNPEVDDVLIYGKEGYILETSRANVFFIKGDLIITPNSKVILQGIIRNYLLKNEEKFPFGIHEADIHLNDLDSFDEIFLTSALRGIFFVNSIKELPKLKSGSKSKTMQKIFLELMNQAQQNSV